MFLLFSSLNISHVFHIWMINEKYISERALLHSIFKIVYILNVFFQAMIGREFLIAPCFLVYHCGHLTKNS